MDDLACAFCHEPLREPVTLPCGHHLCLECVRAVFRKDNACPACAAPFGRPFRVDEALKARLAHLQAAAEPEFHAPADGAPPLLRLDEFSLLALLKADPAATVALGATCRHLHAMAARDDVWMAFVEQIAPHHQHTLGVPWKADFVALSRRRRAYLRGSVQDYNAVTLADRLPERVFAVEPLPDGGAQVVADGELVRVDRAGAVAREPLPNAGAAACLVRGTRVLTLADKTVVLSDLRAGELLRLTLKNRPVAILQTGQEFVVTRASIITLNEAVGPKERVIGALDIAVAFAAGDRVCVAGTEHNSAVAYVFGPSGEKLQHVTLGPQGKPFDLLQGVVLYGDVQWTPGEEPTPFDGVVAVGGPGSGVSYTPFLSRVTVRGAQHELPMPLGRDALFALDGRNGIVFVGAPGSTMGAAVRADGFYRLRFGPQDAPLRGLCADPDAFRLYVVAGASLRRFDFGVAQL